MILSTSCKQCHSTEFLGVECAWPDPSCLGRPPAPRLGAATRLLRGLALLAAVGLAAIGIWQLGHAGYIQAKAHLAQVLIGDAWHRVRAGETQARPWPWADTWPVARVRAPAQQVDLYVLAGADGRSLAFGPGHMYGTAEPGRQGNSVIGAHRDTHFAFLQWIEDGDPIEVETAAGTTVAYRVVERRVVDKDATGWLAQDTPARELTLVTCYPFDAVRAGGRLRFVVRAVAGPAVEAAAI